MAKEDPVAQLKDFVAVSHNSATCTRRNNGSECLFGFKQDPDSKYSFNSDRDAPQAEICREGKNLSRKCITVRFHSLKYGS